MTLEDYTAELNRLTFWREFTFARTKFAPQPGRELELADNLIWFGNRAYVLQLKERKTPTGDPAVERTWFEKKVLGNATSQIRDSLRFLDENHEIQIANEKGHHFEIRRDFLATITKIVVYLPDLALPEDCWQTRYHDSRTAGFIHILPVNDYLGILDKLRVPQDIARYFAYRENVLPALRVSNAQLDEADIMGAFLNEEDMPSRQSREQLRFLVQDFDKFDLSGILRDLSDHIDRSERPYDYYRILQEFAHIPRSVWREIKLHLVKSIDAARDAQFTQPFRLTFPETDCTFMVAPLDPEMPATSAQGEKVRTAGLQNLTRAAMYLARTGKAVGILVSRDGEYFQIDWCLIEMPWQADAKMDKRLAENMPFRSVSEKFVDGFLFRTPAQ